MVLVLAATPMELVGAGEAGREVGVGPAAAAEATLAILDRDQPDAVIHVGIAGARRGGGPTLCEAVIGASAVDCDGGAAELAPDDRLLLAALQALPEAWLLPIGTSATVGGTREVPVEAMEGHAVLAACHARGVPAIEVRVVSNEIEEADRARWRFEEAFAEVSRVTGLLVVEVRSCLS